MSESYYERASSPRRSRSQRKVEAERTGFWGDLRTAREHYTKRTSTGHKRFVLLLLLVGIGLRTWMLFQPITHNEAYGFMRFALQPVGTVLSDLGHTTNHIFHTLLMKASVGLFGHSVVAMRLPAFMAGIMVMPLFYVFVRSMFNRYIALLALALAASSGGLIEYSAIAQGYSITWCCMLLALLGGRHFIKQGEPVSAILVAFFSALSVWAVPSSFTAVLMVYTWLLLSMMVKYDRSLRARLLLYGVSVSVFFVLAAFFYTPVILDHGPAQIIHQGEQSTMTWKKFSLRFGDSALDLWAYFSGTATAWLALLGFIGVVQAAYISSKFRTLCFALLVGAVPVVLLSMDVGAPKRWLYTLFFFHLSSAIALYYLLKLIQEKLVPALGKRTRTVITACMLLVVFSWLALPVIQDRIPRFASATAMASALHGLMQPGDRLYSDRDGGPPLQFALWSIGAELPTAPGSARQDGTVYIYIAEAKKWTVEQVFAMNGSDPAAFTTPRVVKEREGSMIFAARSRGGVPSPSPVGEP